MDFDSRGQRDKTEDGSQTLLKPIADYDERYPEYVEWLSYLNRAIPHGSPVLDLGCGSGVPCTKMLAENFEVTGLDISEAPVDGFGHRLRSVPVALDLAIGIELFLAGRRIRNRHRHGSRKQENWEQAPRHTGKNATD